MSLLACLAAVAAWVDQPGPPVPTGPRSDATGGWKEIPLPGQAPLASTGIEPGGVLWILAEGSLHYFDGRGFREVEVPADSGRFLPPLLGGPDRGLFVARSKGSSTQGEVYRLTDGRALRMADFHHSVPHQPPGLLVARSGRLVNWGDRFLAAEEGGRWTRIEALLDQKDTHVFEFGDRVHFHYDGNLYSVDGKGEFSHREIDRPIASTPRGMRVHAARWGEDRMFLVEDGTRKAHAYRLATGEAVPLEEVNRALEKGSAHDLIGLADGSLLLLVLDPETNRFVFLEVSAEGRVRKAPETERLGWTNLRHHLYPGTALHGTDGSIWFATPRNGIGRWRGGELRLFGWRDGLPDDFRHLVEGEKGEIYAASERSLHVYHGSAPADGRPSWVERWDELRLAGGEPVRDGEGNVWVFLEDRAGKASRWDGEGWLDVDVPFGTRKVSRAIADDRGHVLVTMAMHPDGCYDVGRAGATKFVDLPSVLVAAVEDGAREFFPDRSFQGIVVVDGGKIWFGYQGHHGVHYWDGRRWDSFATAEPVYFLCESPRHGVLVRTQSGAFLAYDRGQLLRVPLEEKAPSRWLLGPGSLQPFEEELLARRPGRYVPVEKGEDGRLHLLLPGEGIGARGDPGDRWRRGPALDPRVTMLATGFREGHFSRFPREPLHRILGGVAFPCDFRGTPLLGRESVVLQVLEDRGRNLWFDLRHHDGGWRIFLKRMRGFEARVRDLPARATREVALRVEAGFPGERQEGARFFWRVGGGHWLGGETADRLTVRFPSEGRHGVEIAAMDPAGGLTPEPFRFEIDVRVPLPETVLAKEGPHVARDVIFAIPAKALASEPGANPRLRVRFAGEDWKEAYRSGFVPFFGLEPGTYEVEVAAFEDPWGDPSPLRLAVEYAPDIAAVLASRLARIAKAAGDGEEAQAAVFELRAAGPALVPHVEKRLEEARRAAKEASVLEALLEAIHLGRPATR